MPVFVWHSPSTPVECYHAGPGPLQVRNLSAQHPVTQCLDSSRMPSTRISLSEIRVHVRVEAIWKVDYLILFTICTYSFEYCCCPDPANSALSPSSMIVVIKGFTGPAQHTCHQIFERVEFE